MKRTKLTKKVTTLQMELALMRYFKYNQQINVPNVTPLSGLVSFETDVLVLSNSGYATGIEIKITKADLLNDLKKRHIQYMKNNTHRGLDNTTDKRYHKNLKYFYYAVPVVLKEEAISVIPDRAGLLVVKNGYVQVARPAEVLSTSIKWTDKNIFNLLRIGVMRIYTLKRKINR